MSVLNDLRLAARTLLRDKTFAVTALFALALGIAANATVFTIVNAVFFRDLPFADPDRIVAIETRGTGQGRETDNVSYADLADLQATARLFDGIAGVVPTTMNVADEEHGAERFSGAYISANAFDLLGHRPALGRDFQAADDRPGADPVVILGHDIWQRRYGGDRAVLGRMLRVNGVAATIVGVMPSAFAFPQVAALWLPLTQSADRAMQKRDARTIEAFGRRGAGVTNEQAQADVENVLQGLARLHPDTNRDIHALVVPYRDTLIGGELVGIMATLGGAVALLLLIACANVANLQLVRGMNGAREIALRLSLGATRGQVVRRALIESLALAAAAGTIGLLLAVAATRVFVSATLAADPPYFLDFSVDPVAVGFVATVCTVVAVICGVAPALHVTGVSVSRFLAEAGRASAGGVRTRVWTGSLVVVQLTLGIVLLGGAGLLASNVLERTMLDPGIDTGNFVVANLELPSGPYPTAAARRAFYERLDASLADIPVSRATFAVWAPTAGGSSMRVSVDGRAIPAAGAQPRTTVVPVGPRYFETIGVTALRGRTFGPGEARPGQLVAVVNERFAAIHFGAGNPLGARIQVSPRGGPDSGEWLTVIGVVRNIRQEEADPRQVEDVVYRPYGTDPLPFTTIIAPAGPDAGAVVTTLRGAVQTVDPNLPLFAASRLSDVVEDEFVVMRVIVSMLSVFALTAVALAAVGLYAVTAYAASRRTREIGVRVALGARAPDVWWLVTRRAATQLGLGLLLGLAIAGAIGAVLGNVFSSVDGPDVPTLAAVAVLMLLVGFLATWSPACRAMRTNPVDALRVE